MPDKPNNRILTGNRRNPPPPENQTRPVPPPTPKKCKYQGTDEWNR